MAFIDVTYSNDNEYYTPKEIVKMFGSFDYDPATTSEKAKEIGINNFDTVETDGLKSDWTKYQRIWINPPFTLKHLFLLKAVESIKQVKNEIYILLPIEMLTTKRFHNIMNDMGGIVYLPNGRIKFESGTGRQTKSPAFGSIILKLENNSELKIKRINMI